MCPADCRCRRTAISNVSLQPPAPAKGKDTRGPSCFICITKIVQELNRHRRLVLKRSTEIIDQYPLSNLADNASSDGSTSSTTFYWQIPRTGSTTLKHVLGSCLDKVQASRVAKSHCDPHTLPHELTVCQTSFGKYVNADPSDDAGIERSKDLKLVESGLADVVVSSRFLHATSLFDTDHKGRVFATIRHPVDRMTSLFRYLQKAHWERSYSPRYKTMSVVDFSKEAERSGGDNWMVRWLTGKVNDALTQDDVEFAKELLRRKFFIILTEDMSAGVNQLIEWRHVSEQQRQCVERNTAAESAKNRNDHVPLKKGSADYEALAKLNALDIQLYEFAKKLFGANGCNQK